MDKSIDLLSDVVLGRESWKIMVRVVRIWEVPSFLKPRETNSLQMVLIDVNVFCCVLVHTHWYFNIIFM